MRAWGALLAALACTPPAAAQTRPRQTEEASTAASGTVILETSADFISGEPNFLTGRERDRWDVPVLRVVWSPADVVELDVEWTGRVMARGDPDFGDVSDWGDVTLRAKVRFLGDGRERAAVAARFSVTLPETSFGNGLGPNTLRMAAQVLATRSFGAWALHANAGLALQDEVLRPHEQRDFLAYGAAIERALGPRLALMAELAGLAGKGMPGADERAELRAGVRLGTSHGRWDLALRRGLARANGSWGISLGVSWALRSGRGPVPPPAR